MVANLNSCHFHMRRRSGNPTLSEQLHDRTFDLIKAEIREDPELILSSIYSMTQSLQAIIDRASHPLSPQPSHTIDQAARGMAIHLDRIDFALQQEDMRKVSLLVGKVAAKVKELEALMETAGDQAAQDDMSLRWCIIEWGA